MHKFIVVLASLLYATELLAQPANPVYEKTLGSFSKWYAGDAPDSIYGLFGDALKSQLSMSSWRQSFPQLKTRVGAIGAFTIKQSTPQYSSFMAIGAVDSINMVLALDSTGRIQGMFLRPKEMSAAVYHTNYKISTAGGELAGELLVPAHDARHKPPVALIIAGSGPTDRNGNNAMGVRAAPYKLLAEELKNKGIATLRYDKRYVGESTNFKGSLDSLRFEDILGDAKACVRKLKADTSFSRVIVIGHSEGALLGTIAAREEKANRFVSLSGVGESAVAVLKRQMKGQLPPATMDQVNRLLDSLQQGHHVTMPAGSPAASLFAPSVQNYLISWFKYDPAKEISRLTMPVLIVQGLTDLQVGRRDAELLKAAAPRATLVLIDSMNHVLKDAPLDRNQNMASYTNEHLPLDKKLVETIVLFIKGEAKK